MRQYKLTSHEAAVAQMDANLMQEQAISEQVEGLTMQVLYLQEFIKQELKSEAKCAKCHVLQSALSEAREEIDALRKSYHITQLSTPHWLLNANVVFSL